MIQKSLAIFGDVMPLTKTQPCGSGTLHEIGRSELCQRLIMHLDWWALPKVRHVIPVHLRLNRCSPSNLGILYSLHPFWGLFFGACHFSGIYSHWLISASYAVPSFPKNVQPCLVIVTLIGRQRLWLGAASELQATVISCDTRNLRPSAGETSAHVKWLILDVWDNDR